MPAPAYPTILTRIDWDKNKGTIGKAPNELGIGPAVSKAEGDFKRVDWDLLNKFGPDNDSYKKNENNFDKIQKNLLAMVEKQQRDGRTASDSLLNLADVTGGVVTRYERAVTFPKPLIDHVRKMKEAALELVRTIGNSSLAKDEITGRKIKGWIRLQDFPFDRVLTSPSLLFHFMNWARYTSFCDFELQFLVDTAGAARGELPRGQKALDLYNTYIKNVDINIAKSICDDIDAFYKKNELIDPPPASAPAVLALWKEARAKAWVMFSPGGNWKVFKADAFKLDSPMLLCPELQV